MVAEVLAWVPSWVVGVVVLLFPAAIALTAFVLSYRSLLRLAGRVNPFWGTLLRRAQAPASAIVIIIVLGAALPAAQFSGEIALQIGHGLLIAMILALGWAAAKALDIAVELYLRRFRMDAEDNLLARKHHTQVNILRRAAQTVLAIVTIAVALMTVAAVRQYGVSLFASAGAAGLVVGLAARPVLSNLLAGVQIAMTQPIRLEDAVVVEGEWGWIEEITSTFVVIRIWDLRRMIVPLSYFMEKPFVNWTYETTDMLGTVILHIDVAVPVQRVRKALEEAVRETKLWDGKVAKLQVTDAPGGTIELRALLSARNSSDMWDLRCLVREKLVDFLRAEQQPPSPAATEPAHARRRRRAEAA